MKVTAGFSLVELMVVITIVSILLTVGVPSYRYVTNSNRISSEVNGLLGDLQFARSEAIKEGSTVTVCPPNADSSACAANSSRWDQGWIVISATATPAVLRVQPPFTNTKDSFVTTLAETSISFDRNGFASALPKMTNAGVTVELTTTPNVTQWVRCVEIGWGGMLTTARYLEVPNCK
jgi:type IV fimbrial biogenesis protein FimT